MKTGREERLDRSVRTVIDRWKRDGTTVTTKLIRGPGFPHPEGNFVREVRCDFLWIRTILNQPGRRL